MILPSDSPDAEPSLNEPLGVLARRHAFPDNSTHRLRSRSQPGLESS